ncbi:MAG: BamA/TamA family outer membrane protein [Ignavibacteriae bacterium]|nr:BamA/TamA family outer membrane protein [Ignavibacteriota bacterium]
MKYLTHLIGFTLIVYSSVFSVQLENPLNPNTTKDTLIIPGERYGASWMQTIFTGSNWRNLWTTPIKVKILDLDHFAGGLTPFESAGRKQTKGLKFRGKDGKEYKFRSTDKDAKRFLPQALQESIAGDFLQDQISSSNPLAPIIVAPFLNAVGVLSPEPLLVVLPNDQRLGPFQKEFGGMLGTLQENPSGGTDEEPGYAGADQVIKTFKLYERLENDPDEQVDAREYLKARLMDVYLGDWDRHKDQWRWAGFKQNGKWLWKPIPLDRDWAFTRFQGFVPWIVTMMRPQLKGFGRVYPGMEELTWDARYVDRRSLVSLDKPAWDSVTNFILEKITDSVIDYSVHRFPPEMYAMEGEEMKRTLKARKEKLSEVSDEYYRVSARFPDLHGTNKDDYAEIRCLNDTQIMIALYRRDKQSGEKKGEPYYVRTFNEKYTKDIRLSLLDGDDKVVVDGDYDPGITLRVIGGEGQDEFIDNSRVETQFYDSGENTKYMLGSSSSLDHEKYPVPKDDSLRYEPVVRDYGHLWRFTPWYGFNPDDGLFLGGGPILYDYGFRVAPYMFRMQLVGGYATTARKFRVDYTGEFNSLIKGAHVLLHARVSQLDHLKFFGFGNETPFDADLHRNGFYNVRLEQFSFEPSIDFFIHRDTNYTITMTVGGTIKYVESDLDDGSFLKLTQPSEDDRKRTLGGLHGGIHLDTRNQSSATTAGLMVDVRGSYFPVIFNNKRQFGKLRGEVRTYLSPAQESFVTLALRTAGEKTFGDFPFFESSFLGGSRTLRGYAFQRFAGDASFFGNGELRLRLGRFSFLFPGWYGLSFLGEAGRVLLRGETSSLWHSSIGAGIWISVYKPRYTLSISVARSIELTGVYVTGGFMF